jgi:hypothetical protein
MELKVQLLVCSNRNNTCKGENPQIIWCLTSEGDIFHNPPWEIIEVLRDVYVEHEVRVIAYSFGICDYCHDSHT